MGTNLELEIARQPNDSTCGPTCLHAVYRYYGDPISLEQVIDEVASLETGGTLAVQLACHALSRGFQATIYTYNLHLFDPTWFRGGGVDLAERLREQANVKSDPKLRAATGAYLEFLAKGGRMRFRELNGELIRGHLRKNRPILTGLSATYLYDCSREFGTHQLSYDDVRGEPVGHFVVLSGYDQRERLVMVADPLHDNPGFSSPYYSVGMQRLLGAILLGVLTYDANLLVLEPGDEPKENATATE